MYNELYDKRYTLRILHPRSVHIIYIYIALIDIIIQCWVGGLHASYNENISMEYLKASTITEESLGSKLRRGTIGECA